MENEPSRAATESTSECDFNRWGYEGRWSEEIDQTDHDYRDRDNIKSNLAPASGPCAGVPKTIEPTARVQITQTIGDRTLSAQEIWDLACDQLVNDYGCLFEPVLRNLTLVDFDPAIRQYVAVFRPQSAQNLDYHTTHGAIRQVLMRMWGSRDIQLWFAPHFRWRVPQPQGAAG